MEHNNLHGLPDEGELERLANQFFKALPGSNSDHTKPENGTVDSLAHSIKEAAYVAPVNDFPDNTKSLSGDFQQIPLHSFYPGASSVFPKTNTFGSSNPQTSLPDPDFYKGLIPSSVTGSGRSFSAKKVPEGFAHNSAGFPDFKELSNDPLVQNVPFLKNKSENFSINNPQTSLPDPHFHKGQISQSVAGSGRSPSQQGNVANQGGGFPDLLQHHFLPFEAEQTFEKTLKNVFTGPSAIVTGKQIPSDFSALGTNPQFYFLGQENPFTTLGHGTSSAFAPTGFVKPPFDINKVRNDFPIFKERVNGKPLVWLDNAATTQKPNSVIDRLSYFYEHENSNIHRAAHELAARATDAYEGARKKVQHFLGAASPNEIVFVRGTTEAINLVAKSWGAQFLKEGDEIILSHLEHHANIVPWKMLADKKNLKIRVIPVDDDGQVLLEEYGKLLNSKTKLVAFTHVSNALGTITPAKTIIDMAHAQGAKVLLDGAQSVSHMRINLQYLNPDFFVFSGHKIFGPTGIGVLYGKEEILNDMQPWQGGGNMIKDVTFEHVEYHKAPGKFEAGTGNIADAVGLGAALDYVSKLGMELIDQYEHALLAYATNLIRQVPGLRQIGTAREKASVLSFTLEGYTNDEVGQALNKEGIAVRTGHHCAQPILRRFGVESSVRPSLAFYNTCDEINLLINTLHRLADGKNRKKF